MNDARMLRDVFVFFFSAPDTQRLGEAVIREQLAGIPNPKVQAKAAEYLRELHDGMRDFRF